MQIKRIADNVRALFFKMTNWNKVPDEKKLYIDLHISLYENLFENGCIYIYIYIYIYNLHGLSCQEKVSRFSMLLIPRYGTSLAVSHWKLRMVLMVEYRSSRLDQNKPFSGPVSTLLSSSADFTVSACPVAFAPLDLLH